MSSSKIDHKELQKRLKEDAMAVVFSEISQRSRSIYQQYGSVILMGLAFIAVAYTGYSFWLKKSASDNVSVQQQFAVANTLMQQQQYEAATTQLGTLLDEFPNAEITPLALMLRADSYIEQENYELAAKDYQNAAASLNGPDAVLAQVGLIQAQRSLKKPDEALAVIQNAMANVKSEELKEQLYYLEGLCYEDKGEDEKALQSLRHIAADSGWYMQARQRIEWLEAKPVDAIN